MKVAFATPSLSGPMAPYLKALEDSARLVDAAGIENVWVQELGNPYISAARSIMTRKSLDAGADIMIYLDYDLSWDPKDLLTLIQTDGDVVAGTYRFKQEPEEYMGALADSHDHRPIVREDGAIKAHRVPAGFLKVTAKALDRFAWAYPNLLYGCGYAPSIDLFNHGAYKGTWYGEDYSFSRNWIDIGGEIWLVPNLNINHHSADNVFRGNFHEYMLRQPGGSNA
jgi:hypothetical protein